MKFTGNYKSYTGSTLDLTIQSPTEDKTKTIEFDSGGILVERAYKDKFHAPIWGMSANLKLLSPSNFYYGDLFANAHREYSVDVKEDNAKLLEGWLISERYKESFAKDRNYPATFSANDGLGTLDRAVNTYFASNKLHDIIYTILLQTGKDLPINYGVNLFWQGDVTGLGQSPFLTTYQNTAVFADKNCKEILESILHNFGARIFQYDGEWWIYRVVEYADANTKFVRLITQPDFSYSKSYYELNLNYVIGKDRDVKFIGANQQLEVARPLELQEIEFDTHRIEELAPGGKIEDIEFIGLEPVIKEWYGGGNIVRDENNGDYIEVPTALIPLNYKTIVGKEGTGQMKFEISLDVYGIYSFYVEVTNLSTGIKYYLGTNLGADLVSGVYAVYNNYNSMLLDTSAYDDGQGVVVQLSELDIGYDHDRINEWYTLNLTFGPYWADFAGGDYEITIRIDKIFGIHSDPENARVKNLSIKCDQDLPEPVTIHGGTINDHYVNKGKTIKIFTGDVASLANYETGYSKNSELTQPTDNWVYPGRAVMPIIDHLFLNIFNNSVNKQMIVKGTVKGKIDPRATYTFDNSSGLYDPVANKKFLLTEIKHTTKLGTYNVTFEEINNNDEGEIVYV
ncbi:hypothetical protein [Xanthovirga aplysinae]|uniref:hypothetical protein n=1 Tax=Xanthovirga aplysinae TaxID=2529853 RepID=UPI0012BCE005|nr:hypothetical protein [Xanthovirga aplysinae]MTI32820.1 hypothetical protein [Xanthovirga aplysinae]